MNSTGISAGQKIPVEFIPLEYIPLNVGGKRKRKEKKDMKSIQNPKFWKKRIFVTSFFLRECEDEKNKAQSIPSDMKKIWQTLSHNPFQPVLVSCPPLDLFLFFFVCKWLACIIFPETARFSPELRENAVSICLNNTC